MAHRPEDEGPSPNVEDIACACIGPRAPSSERVPAKKTKRTLGKSVGFTAQPSACHLYRARKARQTLQQHRQLGSPGSDI